MKRVVAAVLLALGGCVLHRAPLSWQAVDMKNTCKTPRIYTLDIVIPASKVFSVEMPFCIEYSGRWALVSTEWHGAQIAIDVNDSILLFPYAQSNEWVVHSLPSFLFYGALFVPADRPNEKQGMVCVARQGPGTSVPKLMASRDALYETPAIFPFRKDAKGNAIVAIKMILWPDCTAKIKVKANCKIHIDSISTDMALIATHERALANRILKSKITIDSDAPENR